MKKSILFLIVFAAYSLHTMAQTEAFPQLKKLKINTEGSYFIKYNATLSQVINRSVGANNMGLESNDIKLIDTKLSQSDNTLYTIVFSYGPSDDPTFMFYRGNQSVFSVSGEQLYLTGNGVFYVSGRSNKMYQQRQKFMVRNGQFTEQTQPFYYVGLKSKTLRPIKLYEDIQQKKQVASLPANYEVEVILNQFDENQRDLYLIRTSFGLTGWFQLPEDNYGHAYIEGLYYMGD